MIRRLKRLFRERIVLPMAFRAFAEEPSRLSEFLAHDANAQVVLLRAVLSSRDLSQGLLARLQDLLAHASGHEAVQTRVAGAITGVISDDGGAFASLSQALIKGLVGERRLAQMVVREAETLVPHVLGNPELEAVVAAAVARLAAESVTLRNGLRRALHEDSAWRTGVLGDRGVLLGLLAQQGGSDWQRLEAMIQWHVLVGRLRPWLEEGPRLAALETQGAAALNHVNELRRAFFASACGDGELPLRLGRLRLPDEHSFWPQLFEIFVREDYAFNSATAAPRIIDAGMHMGLATYYFKARYPEARIVGFEPSPTLRAVVEENVRRCGFSDVTIEPYALFKADGTLQFHVDADDTMAGSLLASHHAGDAHSGAVEVTARRLSPYLAEPVDYLKLDIEGAEGGVLEECRGVLGNVDHLFIEYHEGHAPEENSLPAILSILDAAGFDYEVSKSHGYQVLTEHDPMMHVGKPYSAIIWAKNRVWPPAGMV